jgi:hypothetical protein
LGTRSTTRRPHAACSALTVGLYYLVRSLAVSPAALVGGARWAVAPRLPFVAAAAVGALGTLVFAATVSAEHAA